MRVHDRERVPRQQPRGEPLTRTAIDAVLVERDGPVTIVSINRPHCRNAVDGATARKLFDAFRTFDADGAASVAVFTGTAGHFCAGADLKALAAGDPHKKREIGAPGARRAVARGIHTRSARSVGTTRSPRWGPAGCVCQNR